MRNPMLLVALGLGAVAAIGTFLFVGRKHARDKEKEGGQKAVVVQEIVAKTTIYPHSLILPDMVESQKADQLDPTACQDLSEVIDHVALSQVAPGEKLYRYNVSGVQGQTTRPVVSFEVPLKTRAYCVVVDPAMGAGGLLQVGDRVDVLVIYDLGERAMARTVVQDLQVLATEFLGEKPAEPAATEDDASKKAGKTSAKSAKSGPEERNTPAPGTVQMKVVLAVLPEQAQQLSAAQKKGEISLTIRNGRDDEQVSLDEAAYEQPKSLRTAAEIMQERQARELSSKARALGDATKRLAGWQSPAFPLTPPSTGQPLPIPRQVKPAKTVEVIRGSEREVVPVAE
ncbi:MAG: Flp pilus assembly protein CpaB [Armatimonadetes bacterium CG2_30_66_41]|nr:Flp pilus assembly protein CpaB [Armatimonadota bacterium]OIP08470.1 MAG: Flp pilus assembly protein CpaB [Armatimonadetes bacterium CG2_30_66_41]PJB72561.1 MAG: Flp pilus assembly protein CpaB [Armatimonadetes bacterium CG_4_9_14_3_um_filter_66_14]